MWNYQVFISSDSGWQITAVKVDETGESVTPKGEEEIYQARFVAIATGHHAIPRFPKFAGENTFKGKSQCSFYYLKLLWSTERCLEF